MLSRYNFRSLYSLFLLSLSTLVLLCGCLSEATQSMCWTDECSNGHDWCFQTCSLDNGETSCLAQYRQHGNGEIRPSWFGCHSPDRPCSPDCVPVEGSASDFSCCCTGDLCNSVPGLTPTGEEPTASPNTASTPTYAPHDDILVCEVYTCAEDSENCYYGYEECEQTTNGTPYCWAEYKYEDRGSGELYHLAEKKCFDDTSQWCTANNECSSMVDTSSDQTPIFCCCNDDLCNENIVFTNPERVNMSVVDPCEDMDCHHSCIVHEAIPHCFCDYGNMLADDKKTCIDINECSHRNGGCSDICVNEVGTGYHCGCPDNEKLGEDGYTCEETGLICNYLSCNDTNVCNAELENQYCDDSDSGSGPAHCQATYKLRPDGTFEPRLLSCFAGTFVCPSKDECIADEVNDNIYYCCCDENYCNANVRFPSMTPLPSVTQPTGPADTNTVGTLRTPTGDPNSTDSGISSSKLTFIIVVVLSLTLLIPVVGVGVGCIFYMHRNNAKNDQIAGLSFRDTERALHSPDFTFNDISFIDKIGQGRFAAVWRAKNIEAEVAVKVFPNTPQCLDSWLRECEIYKTPELEHKYILCFRGSHKRDNELWIVTDYYALGSLHDMLKKQTLSLKQFCELAESAAVGLAHLHDQRIVDCVTKKPSIAHRDLKSKNILVRNDFTCVISDFGLAVKFLNEETSADAHGQVGTSRYMAPEVLEGAISFQREAYLRIDVYAFALILWELASRTNLAAASMKQYRPPFDEYVSPNPSIEEMREIVVTQFKRPTIAKGFTTSGDYDCLRDTIEESWDQEPEARLSAQCIAERIRTFKLSKFSSKDSGLTDTNSPAELTYTSESLDSQLAPTTLSLSSSGTMSPTNSKQMLDSGTESIGIYPHRALSNETMRLGNMSSNSSFLPFGSRNSTNFDATSHNFGGSTMRFNHSSNRLMYSLHSTETTV